MCYIAPGMPHEITGLQPTRDSIAGSSGFFRELFRRGGTEADEAYYRRYDSGSRENYGSGDRRSCETIVPGDLIFVSGYFGAPIIGIAEEIAEQEEMDLLILDCAIEKKDGRSIRRICMMSGEHGYRNLEYDAVKELHEAAHAGGDSVIPAHGLVVACSDGILYDEETRELILQHDLVIAGEGMDPDRLWKGALADSDTWHAFMHFGSEEERRAKFDANYHAQRILFSRCRNPGQADIYG